MINKIKPKKDQILMFVAVFLLLLFGGIVFWISYGGGKVFRSSNTNIQMPKVIGKVVLTIDFGAGKKRSFEGGIIDGEKLIDALIQAAIAGKFTYQLDKNSNLAAIENFFENKNKSWHLYLNGKKDIRPLNKINLKSGDNILIQYE